MRYAVLLLVPEGHRIIGGPSPYWERRLTWVTWTVEASLVDAIATAADLAVDTNPSGCFGVRIVERH